MKRTVSVFLYLFFVVCFVELLLQIIGFFGLLPNLIIIESVPFGRVYNTVEGYENSVMNRYGWHYEDFNLPPDSKTIVLIGDSFVEASQVSKHANIGKQLEILLNAEYQHCNEFEVLSLGRGNTGPAHYLEEVKYACAYLNPRDIFILVTLGNDFRNVSRKNSYGRFTSPAFYYTVNDKDSLEIDSQNRAIQHEFMKGLVRNHESPMHQIPRILKSHFLSYRILRTITFAFQNKKTISNSSLTALEELNNGNLNAYAFDKKDSVAFFESFNILSLLLKESYRIGSEHGVNVHLVTIPVFPKIFYQTFKGSKWVFNVANIDLSIPEKKLVEFSQSEHIPILPMGEFISNNQMSVDSIRSLFFNGTGHFTEEGHRFFASAIFEKYYRNQLNCK